ncbi:DNA mismatch repair enzyme (predicted ATPase) [Candidatus Nitrososphaera evergladensis SR1]|uniref:DNA mismatch repair enzyme (Predicted ATPase) n=1 Tax=Candidatus Nitrososphaera evergladensis SR1 TaxID=1459636 RepID=A0A075MXC9_9ARCH|nr:ATP-binding protein [Candidatus Nitrososphaera evergladensis]AIF83959.1 DNA mismatch repair enzyme (predicted ATPase) [Candidatus Nitrososphaera evergladensis SR1]
MATQLKVHPSFFKEFATKTWVSPTEIVKELVENAFDEDATKVLVTVLKNGISIEDDSGMDQNGMEKFLLLGSPHKKVESISPKLKRLRTGRYGTGRLSFLTSFESMRIRTRRGSFHKAFMIDGNVLDRLFTGNAALDELKEPALKRDGTELVMSGSKVESDIFKLAKEIRKLAILRQPLFEVFIKSADSFSEWDFSGAQKITAPDIQGHKIPVSLDGGKIAGEIVIARRPLSDEERGIAVMVGNHIVTRSNFGFDTKLSRVTGYVRCDTLTSRFADKSALIEDEEYIRFNQSMKTFVIDTVIPSLTEYEDVLITREESKIYREIDKVLGQAMVDTLETQEEVQGYEMVDVKEVVRTSTSKSGEEEDKHPAARHGGAQMQEYEEIKPLAPESSGMGKAEHAKQETVAEPQSYRSVPVEEASDVQGEVVDVVDEKQVDGTVIRTKKIRKPIVKKTFALKRIGFKVIPYEDESDSRYSFTSDNVVFVNKANSTYKAESSRGDEFLLRHIINMVAESIASAKHPEGKEALELQNRLVSEAIRIHDYSVLKHA